MITSMSDDALEITRGDWEEELSPRPGAVESVRQAFRERTPTSEEHARRSQATIPGASPSHATAYQPYQVLSASGDGPCSWDADGNQYYDLHNRFTTLVHGHRFPPVTRAIEETYSRLGTGPIGPSEEATKLGELITSRLTCVERIAFCSSGTEAGMLAARIARDATDRPLIVKAESGFHGWFEDLLAGRVPSRAGSQRNTLTVPYGDLTAFQRLMTHSGHEVAAVFIEPVLGAGGILRAPQDYYRALQEATRRAGAILVADEVISIRLAEGGGQSLLRMNPDLTMLGKIVGGGLPIGGVGGRIDLLDRLDPAYPSGTPHFGTFNANPLSCAAGLAALTWLDKHSIDEMDEKAASLSAVLGRHADSLGLPLSVSRAGSLLNLYFASQLPGPAQRKKPTHACSLFHLISLNNGVLFYPRGTLCLSTVVTTEALADILDRLKASLDLLAELTLVQ